MPPNMRDGLLGGRKAEFMRGLYLLGHCMDGIAVDPGKKGPGGKSGPFPRPRR